MKRSLGIRISALLLLPAAAAPGQGQHERGRHGAGEEGADGRTGPPPLIVRGFELLRYDVENAETTLGEVGEVYVNPRGQIVYYVLQTSDTPFEANRSYAVPAACVTPDPKQDRLFLDVSKDRLETFESFEMDERPWPARASGSWCDAVTDEDLPVRPRESTRVQGSTLAVRPATAWSIEDLRGREVTSPDGSRLGLIAEFGFDLNGGRVGFWILSTDNRADLVAIPWEALSFFRRLEPESDEEPVRMVLEASSAQLERAPEFDLDDDEAWINASTPEWLRRKYDDFNVPYAVYHRNAGILPPRAVSAGVRER